MSTNLVSSVDENGVLRSLAVNSSGQLVVAALYGENSTDDRLYGGPAPASKLARTATGAVKGSPGKYYGYIVTTALSAAAITLYDDASAASGTVIDVIPASAAAGTRGLLSAPVPCANGMYASFGGTGTVLFIYT